MNERALRARRLEARTVCGAAISNVRSAGLFGKLSAWGVRQLVRIVSMAVNAVRLRGLHGHQSSRRQSRRVLRAVRAFREPGMAARCLSYLRQVDPLVFEEVVMSALEDAGLLVLRSRSYSGDGGVDGAFWSPALGWIGVQVKRYRSHINRQHIVEFGAAVRDKNYSGGLFVHTGRSGEGVYRALDEAQIHLVSGERLVRLIMERRLTTRRSPNGHSCDRAGRGTA